MFRVGHEKIKWLLGRRAMKKHFALLEDCVTLLLEPTPHKHYKTFFKKSQAFF